LELNIIKPLFYFTAHETTALVMENHTWAFTFVQSRMPWIKERSQRKHNRPNSANKCHLIGLSSIENLSGDNKKNAPVTVNCIEKLLKVATKSRFATKTILVSISMTGLQTFHS